MKLSENDLTVSNWFEISADLFRLQKAQIFFIGGPPRSGTTWLQQLIDSHPEATCRGEGLFSEELIPAIEVAISGYRRAVEEKNRKVVAHTSGYPLPSVKTVDFVAATAVLAALSQQTNHTSCRAYGEKTPENLFAFPRYKNWFPQAKLISIARDPRDVVTSAWHFFRADHETGDKEAERYDFVLMAIPSIRHGLETMLGFQKTYPHHHHIVTYEELHADTHNILGSIFKFLNLSVNHEIVSHCVAENDFQKMTSGRIAGSTQDGSFHRVGQPGGWKAFLSPTMNEIILRECGALFPLFGWKA